MGFENVGELAELDPSQLKELLEVQLKIKYKDRSKFERALKTWKTQHLSNVKQAHKCDTPLRSCFFELSLPKNLYFPTCQLNTRSTPSFHVLHTTLSLPLPTHALSSKQTHTHTPRRALTWKKRNEKKVNRTKGKSHP